MKKFSCVVLLLLVGLLFGYARNDAAFVDTAEVFPYDEVRPVEVAYYSGFTPSRLLEGYYTMSQDNRWGLMRADGAVLLPCESDVPVIFCTHDGWRWECYDGIVRSYTLEERTGFGLCSAHGAVYMRIFL